MKSPLGWLAHAACLAAILLAIWVPFGGRGQWIATAVVLLILGAALLGSSTKPKREDQMSVSYSPNVPEHQRHPHRPTYGQKEDDR